MEEMLIEKVRLRTFLYDTKSPDYRDQRMRANAWEEIGKELNIKPETAKDTWEKLRRCFLNALNRRRNRKSGEGAKKMVPWRFDLEMSFLLPLLYTKNTQCNVQKEENLEDVQIDAQEMDEPEMNTFEIPGGQSNITREETSSHVDSHTEGYFPTKRKQQGRDSAIQQIVNVMKENSYLRQRRHEEKTIRDMDETDMFFLTMAKMTKKLPSLEQAKIKLQLSQAVLQARIALEEQEERPRSTPSVATSR
jgi:hypothetical protein